MTMGPDGAIWFTEMWANKIGRITLDGKLTEYPLPTPAASPRGICAGPDGALWFTEAFSMKLGRITVDGAISELPIPVLPDEIASPGLFIPPHPSGWPHGVAVGADGNVYFTDSGVSKLGRLVIQRPAETPVDEVEPLKRD